ncbi:hypothetical protein, partial [Cytobacillus oceanisediminis]|uniref:hypothetical protein n=1 Tax=Cytobacillus oceanisediminis TaxID=665099 RepID=UPI003736EA04
KNLFNFIIQKKLVDVVRKADFVYKLKPVFCDWLFCCKKLCPINSLGWPLKLPIWPINVLIRPIKRHDRPIRP